MRMSLVYVDKTTYEEIKRIEHEDWVCAVNIGELVKFNGKLYMVESIINDYDKIPYEMRCIVGEYSGINPMYYRGK